MAFDDEYPGLRPAPAGRSTASAPVPFRMDHAAADGAGPVWLCSARHAALERIPGAQETQSAQRLRRPAQVTPRGELSEIEKTNIAIYKQTKPSVVHITSLTVQRDEWTLNSQEVPEGTGSGFVWDEDGHIVTNYHVIKGADAAQVTLADQTTYRAHAGRRRARQGPGRAAHRRPEGQAAADPASVSRTTCRSARWPTPSATRSASTRR